MDNWQAKLIALASAVLCIWISTRPYAAAFGKIGSGWNTWQNHTQAMVLGQTALTLAIEAAAFGLGLRKLAEGVSRATGYLLVLVAPLLGAAAFALCLALS